MNTIALPKRTNKMTDRVSIILALGNSRNKTAINSIDDDILVQEEIYYIRKTKHKFHYGIYIN